MASTRPLRRVDPHRRRGLLYRAYARVIDTPVMAWISRTVGWKLDPVLLRISGGRLSLGLVIPTALLETTGARTREARSNAVIYFHDGDRVVIVASHLGYDRHPAWFHNLVATPEIALGGTRFSAFRVEDPAGLARLWPLADNVFPPYAAYRERAGRVGRTIPIVMLTPVAPAP